MSLGIDALAETRRAFDGVAGTYREENDGNPVIREMRRRTIEAVTSRLPPGSRLLDLGCGPGPDAEHLGRLGYEVLAIDWFTMTLDAIGDQSSSLNSRPSTSGMRSVRKKSGDTRRTLNSVLAVSVVPSIVSGSNWKPDDKNDPFAAPTALTPGSPRS